MLSRSGVFVTGAILQHDLLLFVVDTQGKVEEDTFSQKFAALLTGLYAEQQTAAAEKCGVSGGESWRIAFESASNSGARQVCMPSQAFHMLSHLKCALSQSGLDL